MGLQGVAGLCPFKIYLGKEARTVTRARSEEVRFGANVVPLFMQKIADVMQQRGITCRI